MTDSVQPPLVHINCFCMYSAVQSLHLLIGWLLYCAMLQRQARIECLFIRTAWWLKPAELSPRVSWVIKRLFFMLMALVTLEIITAIKSAELHPFCVPDSLLKTKSCQTSPSIRPLRLRQTPRTAAMAEDWGRTHSLATSESIWLFW